MKYFLDTELYENDLAIRKVPTPRLIRELLGLALLVLAFFFIIAYIAIVPIVGASMLPTVNAQGSTASNPNTYVVLWRSNDLSYNDVVIIDFSYEFNGLGNLAGSHSADDGQHNLIKRVVALAGDTVSIELKDGEYTLKVNGKWVDEPYIYSNMLTGMAEVTVPSGCVFVMGDNRNSSSDSRVFGAVELKHIVGKVFLIIDANGWRLYCAPARDTTD